MAGAGTEKRRRIRKSARVRQSDVAKAAGVHTSTVSLALRAKTRHLISHEQVEHIERVARHLGYRPDAVAVSMRTGKSRLLGMLLHDISDPVYPPIVRGVESAGREHGYMLMLGNTGYDAAAEAELLETFASRRVDGIILATTRLHDPIVETCLASGLPAVSVFRRPADGSIPSVLNNCRGGMAQMVAAVQDMGHRKLAYISAPHDISSGKDRYDGVMDALRPGSSCSVEMLDELTADAGYRATRNVLARHATPPDAIICVNDLVATGAYRALDHAGLRCPQDVSVTGYNGLPFGDLLNPPLSTVGIQLFEMGVAAGEALIRMIEGEAVAVESVWLEPKLIIRESLARLLIATEN